MNALLVALLALTGLYLGYKFYGTFIARRLFGLSSHHVTPAHKLRDDVDYVPTKKGILFSHHFVTIAGLGPILGPAIAVIWGWLPALLWVLFGSIFVGAVHDLSALVISVRHDGRSIAYLAKDMIAGRARILFLFIVFFALALAMGVFALVIATLFSAGFHPEVVIPSAALMDIAMIIGYLVYKRNVPISVATLVGVVLMVAAVVIGVRFPVTWISKQAWIWILLVYAFLASCLPVWLLLQPRDYLNSFQLFLVLGLMYLGIFVTRPVIVAPAINRTATDLPALFPFLFIVVACGAVSGFHSIVASGTTSRQMNKEPQALGIGYGGMILEAVLAVAAILACCAGFKTTAAWHGHYIGWQAAGGLGPKLNAFISGAASFLNGLGISLPIAKALISIIVVGFALTTLDSGTRLLRYNIEDIGRSLRIRALDNRFSASFVAVIAIGFFALMKVGTTLWELFGMTNQLLAGLCFLVVAIYLYRNKKPCRYLIVPMIFLLVIVGWTMVVKINQFRVAHNWTLLLVGGVISVLAVWLITEGILVFRRK